MTSDGHRNVKVSMPQQLTESYSIATFCRVTMPINHCCSMPKQANMQPGIDETPKLHIFLS